MNWKASKLEEKIVLNQSTAGLTVVLIRKWWMLLKSKFEFIEMVVLLLASRKMKSYFITCTFLHFWYKICGKKKYHPFVLFYRHNYERPTPIQAQAIPAVMSGRDLIGIAKTGSGKTLAFVLPMLRHILDQPPIEEGDGPVGMFIYFQQYANHVYFWLRNCSTYIYDSFIVDGCNNYFQLSLWLLHVSWHYRSQQNAANSQNHWVCM